MNTSNPAGSSGGRVGKPIDLIFSAGQGKEID